MACTKVVAASLLLAGTDALKSDKVDGSWGFFQQPQQQQQQPSPFQQKQQGLFQQKPQAVTFFSPFAPPQAPPKPKVAQTTALNYFNKAREQEPAKTAEEPATKAEEPAPVAPVAPVVLESVDPCQCRPFTQAYTQMGVKCGQGFEMGHNTTGSITKAILKNEMCDKFYQRVSFSSCMNTGLSLKASEMWCYVSNECKELNGGFQLPNTTTASVKICQEGHDDVMRTKTPAELVYFSFKTDIELGLLVKLSYPNFPFLWFGEIKDYYLNSPKNVSDTWKENADKPYFLDSETKHPPFGLIIGDQVFDVRPTKMFYDSMLVMESPGKNPSLFTEIRCLRNCDAGVAERTAVKAKEPINSVALFKVPPAAPLPVVAPAKKQKKTLFNFLR